MSTLALTVYALALCTAVYLVGRSVRLLLTAAFVRLINWAVPRE